MVREGRRELTPEEVRSAIDRLSLKTGPARAVLSIATLKPSSLAPSADHVIDWGDRFDGESDLGIAWIEWYLLTWKDSHDFVHVSAAIARRVW